MTTATISAIFSVFEEKLREAVHRPQNFCGECVFVRNSVFVDDAVFIGLFNKIQKLSGEDAVLAEDKTNLVLILSIFEFSVAMAPMNTPKCLFAESVSFVVQRCACQLLLSACQLMFGMFTFTFYELESSS